MSGTQAYGSALRSVLRAFWLVWLLLLAHSIASGASLLWGEPPVAVPVEVRLVGTTLVVPVDVVERFGGRFYADGAVTIVHLEGNEVQFEPGRAHALANGREVSLPLPPQMADDTLWVPLRTVAEHLLEARISYRMGDVHLVPWGSARLVVRDLAPSKPDLEQGDGKKQEPDPEPAGTAGSEPTLLPEPHVERAQTSESEPSIDLRQVPQAEQPVEPEPTVGPEDSREPEPPGEAEDGLSTDPHGEPALRDVPGGEPPEPGESEPPAEPERQAEPETRSEPDPEQELGSDELSAPEPNVEPGVEGQRTEEPAVPVTPAEHERVPDVSAPVGQAGALAQGAAARALQLVQVAQVGGGAMTRYVRLDAPVPPRLRVGLPADATPLPAIELPPVKPTALRAERMDWIEAQLTQGPGGREALHIKASKPFSYNTFLLTDPARLVIDLTGLDTGHAAEPLVVYGPNMQRVRLNQYEPYVVRLVIDLADAVGYAVEEGPEGEVTVILNHMLRSVRGKFDTVSGTVHLDVPRETEYRVLRLADPERLVVDLYDTTLAPDVVADLPAEGPVKNWRMQQFDPSTTRIVFEVERHLDIAALAQYDSLSFFIGHQVRGVGYAALPGIGLAVHLAGAQLPDASVMYLVEPDRLVIDLPGTVLADPLLDTVIDERPAWRIRTGQHPAMVRVVFDLVGAVEYEVLRLPNDQGLAVVMLPPSLAGRSVFLDPGHGGHDPGTMGRVLGLMEKDIVLDVALRLRELLEAAGATVHMSRVGDTFVEVNYRPVLARSAGADVFLSIHANAAPSGNDAGGTETFIYTRPNHPDNARFASAVHRHLVSAIGLTNRGIKQANFGVLRNSFIPSALVEIAFLSRSEEEALLNEAWFRQQVAQGLFNGLVAYFNEGASRAARLSPEERLRVEQGILEALRNDAFNYLPVGTESGGSGAGAVRVQPLIGG